MGSHASKLMDTRRDHILQHYGVAPDARLRSGMEPEVYAYGADAVLKLYPGTASLADLMSLRDFYAGLERQHMPYALPRIRTVAQEAHRFPRCCLVSRQVSLRFVRCHIAHEHGQAWCSRGREIMRNTKRGGVTGRRCT